jgi:hypothetical protein
LLSVRVEDQHISLTAGEADYKWRSVVVVTSDQSDEMNTDSQDLDFYIQVSGPIGGVELESVEENAIKGSSKHFKEIAKVAEAAGQSFVSRMSKMANKPASCSIQFGVDVGGEAGIPLVTKGTVGANFSVTIEWQTEAR